MRRFEVFICSFAVVTAVLVSTGANAGEPLVDVRSVNPTIMVELRYAGRNNFLGHSLYPRGTRALARPEVAAALAVAQSVLQRYQYGLKIWDAYRPVEVQAMLWQASQNSDYVANPEIGVGSLHSWGIAVDTTLVDSRIRDVRMPTDFDDFTLAAMWPPYMNLSFEVAGHVRLLRYAMHKAGFCGLHTEWWHFTVADWKKYVPSEKLKSAEHVLGSRSEGTL